MSNSTPKRGRRKLPKDFPLRVHAGSGQWTKKIAGRQYYFGSVRLDPEGTAALETFERELPYLKRGETPPRIDVSEGCTLRQLVNDLLAAKEEAMKADELSARTFRDYYAIAEMLIDFWGRERRVDDLRPDDFRALRASLAKRYSAHSLATRINYCKVVFHHAFKNGLVDKPVRYGNAFDRPTAKALRRERNAGGPKLFTRDEVLAILNAAGPVMRAMVLLALNGGLGNSDVANLREEHIDADGWLNFPRVKTEIMRRIPLWPETQEAVRAALVIRPKPAEPAARGLIFLTQQGRPWVRMTERKRETAEDESGTAKPMIPNDEIAKRFGKLLRSLKINGRRRLGFYVMRHCFETCAGESKDQVAVDAIMAHVDTSMSANYRHGVSDDRLRAVVGVVHSWLWPKQA